MAVIADFESYPQWAKGVQTAEVTVDGAGGRAEQVYFALDVSPIKDEYTLAYEHADTAITWSMVKGKMQTGQEGSYVLRAIDADRTSVTYELTIHHNLPLPGFVRNRVIKGLVADALKGLKQHLETA